MVYFSAQGARAVLKGFLEATGADPDTIRRGRGWAVYTGVIALAYYGDSHPTLSRISRRTLEAVLAES